MHLWLMVPTNLQPKFGSQRKGWLFGSSCSFQSYQQTTFIIFTFTEIILTRKLKQQSISSNYALTHIL